MKNLLKVAALIVVIGAVTITTSCSKEAEKGETGAAGTNGNANVKSALFTVFPSEWQTSGNTIYISKTSSLITADIANTGGVMLYIQSTNSTSWQALPYTFPNGSSSLMYRFWHSENYLEIDIYGESSAPTVTSNREFKMVVFSSTARLANPNIDYTDYEQVKATFNLED